MNLWPYIISTLFVVAVASCGSHVERKGSLPQEGTATPTPTPEPGPTIDPSEIPVGDFSLTPPTGARVMQVFTVSWDAMAGADRYDVWYSESTDCKNPVSFAGNITNFTASFFGVAEGEFSLCQIAFDGANRAWKPSNNGVRFTIDP